MARNAILMSIRPQYAEKIFSKTKTVELRKVKPKTLAGGDLIFVYVSSPVQSLVGAFKVASVLEKPLSSLWPNVKDYAGISRGEFLDYSRLRRKVFATSCYALYYSCCICLS